MLNSIRSSWAWLRAKPVRQAAAIVFCVVSLPFLLVATYHVFNQSPVCQHETNDEERGGDSLTFREHQKGAYELSYQAASNAPSHSCTAGHTAEEWIALLTAYLVGFTSALATFTALLWWETRKALAKAHDDAERQAGEFQSQLGVARDSADALIRAQRPWVSVDLTLVSVTRNKTDLEWLFRPICRNIGKTPATNVRVAMAIAPHGRHESGWDFAPVVTASTSRLIAMGHKGFSLFPDESDASDGANHKEKITQDEIEAALAPNTLDYAVTVCVWVQYDFVGGVGVTRRIYILSPDKEDRYFEVGALVVDASGVKITRIPMSEQAS